MPYFEVKTESGDILKFLIDTGSSKNYLQPRLAKKKIKNEASFYAKSVVGDIKITEHTMVKLFNLEHKIKFFLMPSLKTFDGILGNDTLRKLKVVIHTGDNYMILGNGKK